jgi:D-beta-D-heptose 7-phosphate kinase/D-beta-D-heptose 1-phosphate adenosyltransferase
MLNLYKASTIKNSDKNLTVKEKTSVIYHNIFDYPLNFSDLIKWSSDKSLDNYSMEKVNITHKNGFYFLEGREGLIYKRALRKRISAKKIKIAKKAAGLLSLIPGIKMIAVTGSLAMENSSEESDIDLMIITKNGLLWTTRALTYLMIGIFGIGVRKPNDSNQKDKLCLNIWLDESDLIWPKKDRNLYTAHEIAQTVPLINKDKTYQKFIYQNKWVLDFWPNAVRVNKKYDSKKKELNFSVIENFAYWFQRNHMKSKVTREVITPTRGVFHPQDWGKIVTRRLSP